MTGLGCDAVRSVAAEFVLGTLDGVERALVLDHLGGCARCREEIAALADTVGDLAVLAPPMPPSAGFTDRVLALGPTAPAVPARRPRRRRWVITVAAAAAVVVLAVGLVARGGSGASGTVAFAVMVAPDRGAMGSVQALGEGAVAVTVDYPSNWPDYQLEAVHLDGTTAPLGPLSWRDDAWRWQGEIPDVASVDRVRVVRPDGTVTCWGRLPA